MVAPHRLLIEILRWACHQGACALNYVIAKKLWTGRGQVQGIDAYDYVAETHLQFRAPIVINCAGPWCRELAKDLDTDVPALFRPSLAFNVLLARRPLSNCALAVTPRHRRARTYFLVPVGDRILAGTYHMAWNKPVGISPRPTALEIESFLGELNAAIQQLRLGMEDVVATLSGWLPSVREGDSRQARRAVLHDHDQHGGPRGLFSVSGVKFTTARAVAERVLRRAIGEPLPLRKATASRPLQQRDAALALLSEMSDCPERFPVDVARLADDESVIYVEDLVKRRLGFLDPVAAHLLARAGEPLSRESRGECFPGRLGERPITRPTSRASITEP
jgi:glycerol-3-phosphate dehydrogenase